MTSPRRGRGKKPSGWRIEQEPGQYIDVRSETRPDIVHHVYTGDSMNGLHCTCEAFRYGTRERDVLFTCKHIELVVFGKGAP